MRPGFRVARRLSGAVRHVAVAAALVAFVACGDSRVAPAERPAVSVAAPAEGVATGVSTNGARFVMNVVGFQGPESVRYDPAQDVFFVSNMAGYGSTKDGNGYITRLSAANPHVATVFVQGGRNGAELDAPKGMAITGDTLWVADIDVLRGFDRHTGAPLATIDFAPVGAVQLNDVAAGPDGELRVTDTGIRMTEVGVIHTGPDRIFALGPDHTITTVASGLALRQPNGITWDAAGKRWLVVSFDPFVGAVAVLAPHDGTRRVLFRAPAGRLDGVETLGGDRILYSSWADSSVHLFADGRDRRLVRDVPEPADIGLDTRRHQLAIPLSTLNRVELWDIGALDSARGR